MCQRGHREIILLGVKVSSMDLTSYTRCRLLISYPMSFSFEDRKGTDRATNNQYNWLVNVSTRRVLFWKILIRTVVTFWGATLEINRETKNSLWVDWVLVIHSLVSAPGRTWHYYSLSMRNFQSHTNLLRLNKIKNYL